MESDRGPGLLDTKLHAIVSGTGFAPHAIMAQEHAPATKHLPRLYFGELCRACATIIARCGL